MSNQSTTKARKAKTVTVVAEVVDITAVRGLPTEVVRELNHDLRTAGRRKLDAFERIALEFLQPAAAEIRAAEAEIKRLRRQLAEARTHSEEFDAVDKLASARTKLELLLERKKNAREQAKQLVAQLRATELLLACADGLYEPSPGFPFKWHHTDAASA